MAQRASPQTRPAIFGPHKSPRRQQIWALCSTLCICLTILLDPVRPFPACNVLDIYANISPQVEAWSIGSLQILFVG